jgi:hypothetical protein
MLRSPDPADWLMWRRTPDSWAVSTGGSLVTGGLNGLTSELRPGASNTLFVFALPSE